MTINYYTALSEVSPAQSAERAFEPDFTGVSELPIEEGEGSHWLELAMENDTAGASCAVKHVIFAFDLEGCLLAWNDQAVIVTGYGERELHEMRISDLFGEDSPRFAEIFSGGTDAEEEVVSAGLTCRDGRRIPYEFQVGPLRDDCVETPGIIAVGSDVIGHRRMEVELSQVRAQKDAVEDHLKELENLVAVAAHELRHPATIFKGYSTLLLDMKSNLDQKVFEEALRAIDSSADRLVHLVEELFESALIERNELELEYREVFPSALIASAIERVMTLGYDLKFTVRPFDGDQGKVVIDPGRLQEVLTILLENAAKYSPEGEEVEVWFEQDERQTVLTVADRGPGVPEKDRERIFERFYQVEDIRHHSKPGIGLGLHIAKFVVEAHDGWIRMEPREGGGSLFSFMTPNNRL